MLISVKVPGLLLLILLMFNCSGDPATETKPASSERFQKVLDNKLKIFNGKGVSASIVFQNQDRWSGASGVSHTNTPVTEDMIFGVGSVTKVFIAALCLQLADEGAFTLDDSLHMWLPDYPNIDNSITLRQLLYNTSGLYNITDNTALWNAVFDYPSKLWTPEELMSAFLDQPYATPGAGYFYSNTNYIL